LALYLIMKSADSSFVFPVFWYDADMFGRIKPSAICNFLQETAWRDASRMGFGFEDVTEQNQVWVLVGLLLKVNYLPGWGSNIIVKTWPRKVDRLFAYRDFRVMTEQDDIIGGASSSWMLLDMDTRRPLPLNVLKNKMKYTDPESALDSDAPLLKTRTDYSEEFTYKVQYGEIDYNGHVNNTRYIDWCMNALSQKFHSQRQFHQLEINFLSEVKGDEIITMQHTQEINDVTYFEGKRSSDGKKVLRSSFYWKTRDW